MSGINPGTVSPKGSDKHKHLIVAIHQIMEEYGWRGIEKHIGSQYDLIIYVKSDSNLEKIELKAQVLGTRLSVNFLGRFAKRNILDKIFDLNTYEIPKKFELAKYVADDGSILNEQRLRNVIGIVLRELEDAAGKK
ncbi:hypothetical protein [Methanohalobium sp.]|uniref:hypothetical protein n=1 Tax=Methanohalobium sp. TaxID=2837493 RepID=UPI0025F8BBC1|nr:hypothetical protein [Methanohalobium sp.]